MEQEFDTILVLDTSLNEAVDPRARVNSTPSGAFDGTPYLQIDPFLKSPVAFGNAIQRHLSHIGDGYSCTVDDFGREVVVRVTYNNTTTARSASKTFLIKFSGKEGDGIIKSSSAKWRTISGISQAESYIRSASNALVSITNQQI